jgi:tetratricopeptide (TPR) repeat protein
MFEWVLNILNAGGTGVFVTLVLGLEAYLRDRRASSERATIEDYLEWLRREDHRELLQSQQVLLDKLQEGGEQSEVLQFHLDRILQTVQGFGGDLSEIRRQVERIDDVDRKLDLLLARLPSATPNQVVIDARVLDVLTSGLMGSGIRIALKSQTPSIHEQGTLMIAWRLGTKSPQLMLADCVGGIHENRLSLILNQDASLSLRAYDGNGTSAEITSPSHASSEFLIGFAVWQGRDLHLWTNDRRDGAVRMSAPFQCLGPTVLFGIDIEGVLSAHAGRASNSAMKMGMSYFLDHNGFNLQKDGIWHGSRYDTQCIWSRPLDANAVHELTLDPFALLQRTGDRESKLREVTLAIEHERDDPTLYIERGIVCTWNGDFAGAIVDFDKAIRIDPTVIDPYLLRGVARNAIGELEQAIVDYRRSLTIDPRNTDAHCRLAWLFATSPHPAFRSAEDAMEHALEAYDLGSWRPDVLDVLAASYSEAGDFAGAVKYEELALAGCVDKFKNSFSRRLSSYRESHPFRDDAWVSLKQAWRHYQRLEG